MPSPRLLLRIALLALLLLLAAVTPTTLPQPPAAHAGPRHAARVTTPRAGKRWTRSHVVLAA
jgi:hypothetical protein